LAIIVYQKSHMCHITLFLLQHVLKTSSCSTNASGRCWLHSPKGTFNNCVTQSSSLAVDASFQIVDVRCECED